MAGYKQWANEEVLTHGDLNGYLMAQVVPRFTSPSERSAAMPSPADGALSFVPGLGLQKYRSSASAWVAVFQEGVVTLVAGTATVSSTLVTANSRILLTAQSLGTVTAPKALAVTARTAGTSFTITSADVTDTSVIAWHIVEPP